MEENMYGFTFSMLVLSFIFFPFFSCVFSCVNEKYFVKLGKGGVLESSDILSSYSVLSSLYCAQYCLQDAECVGFNYRLQYKGNNVNCQLSKQSSFRQNYVNNEEWMYYKSYKGLSVASPPGHSRQCLNDSVCENGGECVQESHDRFRCECDLKHEGQRCEQARVFKSCIEALNISSDAKDGVYRIKTNKKTSNYTDVYCQMTSLRGCEGGGWTMVMKMNGSMTTFQYNSTFWKNKESFNVEGGQTSFDFNETKLPTFWSTSFKELCIGMKVANHLNFLSLSYPARSLYSLFADGKYRPTNVSREKWKSLLPGSSLQTGCRQQGFNVDTKFYTDVRLGYVGNEQEHCNSTDSFIGLGGNHNPHQWCNYSIISVNTAGNLALCAPDSGDVDIKAMGYLLVR